MSNEQEIVEAAAQWHAATGHDDMDWDGFTLWLEADPDHRRAYDEVALADSLLDDHSAALRESLDVAPAPHSPRRRYWIGSAVAAAIVAMVALPPLMRNPETIYETQSASQHIALNDGSTIELSPRSRLVIDGNQSERMALSGGAYFSIAHAPQRKLVISAGPAQITDIGTQFDVQANGAAVRVGVAEGHLNVSSDTIAKPINITEGHALRFDGDAGTARIEPISSETVGDWRHGHLHYNNVPLPLVAADLERYAGVRVMVPAELNTRTFSGSLVASNGQAAARDLAVLMGLTLRPTADGYRLDTASE
jgi:transmembrane sensor